jgi:hypothetical protein
MIIYGTSMQDRNEEIPKDVAEWLINKIEKYPNVDFMINHDEMIGLDNALRGQLAELMKGFSRIFIPERKTHGKNGVRTVVFPYTNEIWRITITGGLDADGNIIGRSDPEISAKIKRNLPPELRNEIAGLDEIHTIDEIQLDGRGALFAKAREEGEPLMNKPEELIPFPYDIKWTSEVNMTGEQFTNLMQDPETREQTRKAIEEKDWDSLRELRNRKMH